MDYATVRDYAIGDVQQPLQIFRKQEPALIAQSLGPIFDLECSLLPLLSHMRSNGIRIDRRRRYEVSQLIRAELNKEEEIFKKEYGCINVKSARQIADLFDKRGWSYNRTLKGNPSFNKEQLEEMDNDFSRLVLSMREHQTMLNNFIEGAWVEYDTDSRIHCDFLPLRKDEGGTVTGRYSSQHPNLQQVSADKGKDHPLSGLMREIFVPEEDHWYGCIDYSQIEYRLIAHYAKGPGSEAIRQRYIDNPNTDYHQAVMDMMHIDDRTTAKRLNFGIAYFMGAKSMARKFHWPLEVAQAYFEQYIAMVPFINETRYAVVDRAKAIGFIRTIYGRRARMSDEIKKDHKEYVAFNRLIQGSAADLNKLAMSKAYAAGIFDVLPIHLTVHDELGVSVPKTIEGIEAYEELKHIMETALEFRIPIIASAEYGPSWGKTKACNEKGTDEKVFSAMRKEIA